MYFKHADINSRLVQETPPALVSILQYCEYVMIPPIIDLVLRYSHMIWRACRLYAIRYNI